MCSDTYIQWHWQLNNDPVVPVAVVAWNDVVPRLFNHLRQNLSKYDLSKYQFVKSDNFVVIIGESSLLPWVNGVQYAMIDSQEPRLWLPCHAKPSISLFLLAEAIGYKFKCEQMLLWDQPKAVIPLAKKWPLTKEFLEYVK
jgi:hypothetical protein